MRTVTLKCPRLSLEPTTAAHALAMFPDVSGARGRALTRFMGWEPPKTRRDSLDFARRCRAGWKRGDWTNWTMLLDGEVVGSIGLLGLASPHRSAELGLWVLPRHHRKGLGFEASRAVLDFAFGPLRLDRVLYPYYQGNTASAALARKLGARPEGVLRKAILKRGRRLDHHLCGILKEEWARGR